MRSTGTLAAKLGGEIPTSAGNMAVGGLSMIALKAAAMLGMWSWPPP